MSSINALPKNVSRSRSNWTTDIFFLTVIVLLCYLLWLGSYPLFTPDEGRYSEVAREMVASGDYVTPRVNGVAFLDKPVLYYWLQAAAIHLFGIREWALRFFPAVFGTFGCILTYACGRRLFDRRTGLLSAIILASAPLYFGGAHYANLDLEVAVLISASLLLFITGVQSEGNARRRLLLGAYTAAALAFLTKGLIGIAFPAMITCAWIILLSRWRILLNMHLIKGLFLFALIVLPWYVLAQQANPEFLHFFFVTQQVSRFLSAGEFNNPTPFWFYMPIVLAGFYPWTGFLFQSLGDAFQKIRADRHEHLSELYLLLWVAVIFIFFSIPRSKTITYILPIFPALAMLTGRYLSQYWDKARQPVIYWSIAAVLLLGVFIAGALISLSYYHWMDLRPGFMPYLKTMAGLYLVGSLISPLLMGREKLFPLFALLAVNSLLVLLTLTVGAKHLNQNTAKPLITDLQKIIKPQDEVITYFKFYQDVPLYLRRRITIVADWKSPRIAENDNWMRELWYGMPFQNTDDWLIDENQFWTRWNGEKRVFVFVNENYFDQFKLRAPSYYFLGQYHDIMLLSNKPTLLSMAAMFPYP
ncbi:Undecaprenyl phosphate-alpha-4-amino-4-deoxy-L-arabinose arabinosyl transferase [Aquicella siphonis]|uniref:Undecaprenyl phosphate-alpha-4-amino-4-deoxy-L-arabinose arabinosyl transferase n=1 Tax=Aquicella siphonis TaxID=254247 RepID=A0A5E4PHA7_9COXI|nr:glycosyltransferase family 39 protein [Aquicella siphonis]VVC75706.1 Undecaprenyl phosphate-alpha-4-amino-4-deoxy-L-arabinose arabinosyl transferase [Aquicella siphonis]